MPSSVFNLCSLLVLTFGVVHFVFGALKTMYTPDKPPTGKRTRKTNVKSEQHERSGGSYNMEDKMIYQCQNDLSRGPIPDIVLRHLQQDRFRMVFVAEDSGAGDTNSVEMRHIKVMILMKGL